jgi:hypothetical protein
MAKPPRPWTVTRHDPIDKLEENLWTISGDVPGLPFSRRMTIIKQSDGTLVFYNAIPLDDASLAEVKAWGKPSVLIVPHDGHMIDARSFAERLDLKIYGPKECAAKTKERAPMAGTLEDLPTDPSYRIEPVAGVKNGEPALFVNSPGGRTNLLLSDVIMNNTKDSIGLFPRMMGFAGAAKIVPVFRMMFLKDKAALKAQLQKWADVPGLARLVPCHGRAIADAPPALRSAADTL